MFEKKGAIRAAVMARLDQHIDRKEEEHAIEQARLDKQYRELVDQMEREHFDRKLRTTESFVNDLVGSIIGE